MSQNSGNTKFPAPIPNPHFEEDDKTDPGLDLGLDLVDDIEEEEPTPIDLQRPVPNPPNNLTPAPQSPPPVKTPVKMPELGILEPLMKDPSISEIMVNDLRNVMIERNGRLELSAVIYPGIDELNRLVRNVLDVTGRIISPDSPYIDTRLPDGSRVNIVVPPLTLGGPCITIRKFPEKALTIHELLKLGALDQKMAYFLNCCVIAKQNLLICGGTGSGKTTLLNVLTTFIPKDERMITIEDTPELTLQHVNSVRLQTKPQSPTSSAITARDLVANALRMRPDRIIVGECRRTEAFDMLQAMNTGHQGSMTTIHANSVRDGLSRLETLCLLAGADLPLLAIRKQMASALDLIVQVQRFRNGKRRVTAISEITGMEGEIITLQDLFVYESTHTQTNTSDSGRFKPTGMVPMGIERLREYGIQLPNHFFNVES
jgi:pilus assembly protein CpaF